jgi:hypothetical protein
MLLQQRQHLLVVGSCIDPSLNDAVEFVPILRAAGDILEAIIGREFRTTHRAAKQRKLIVKMAQNHDAPRLALKDAQGSRKKMM